MEVMVAYRVKDCMSSEGLEYVLWQEDEDWLKPVEVAKVVETSEQANGEGRASRRQQPLHHNPRNSLTYRRLI